MVIERPEPTEGAPQHLYAKEGYDYAACREEAARQAYMVHDTVQHLHSTLLLTTERKRV